VYLLRYLRLLAPRWLLFLVVAMLAGGTAFFASSSLPPTYRASAVLVVNQSGSGDVVTYSDALLNLQLVKTYSRIAQQPDILETVHQRLNLPFDIPTLTRMVKIQPIRETQLIEVAVEGRDPETIRQIVDAIVSVFVETVTPRLPPDQTGRALWVAQPARVEERPVGPNTPLNTLVAAVFGLMGAVGFVALRHYLDDTVKSPEVLEETASLATLGVVPKVKTAKDDPAGLLTIADLHNQASEAYRLIRTNLEFAGVDRPLRTLLVTSAGPSEGKSTVAANLASVLALAGQRVILVDCDLRRPNVHRIFDVANQRGMTSLLLHDIPPADSSPRVNGVTRALRANGAQPSMRLEARQQSESARGWVVDLLDQTLVPMARTNGAGHVNGSHVNGSHVNGNSGNGHHAPEPVDVRAVVRTPEPNDSPYAESFADPAPVSQPNHARWIAEYLQPTHIKNLRVLTSGPLPPNPAELLASPRLANCLAYLSDEADVVVIDSPPVLAVSDPLSIASRVDATVLIVDSQKTRSDALKRAAEALTRSGTRILGAVLNNMREGADGSLYYTAYYGPREERPAKESEIEGMTFE
jgi:Mrp family chromosome partitioning ATPase/capsular polysaccharide biosynthesis protein